MTDVPLSAQQMKMFERTIEELETCANFCRGMSLDPTISKPVKQALLRRAEKADEIADAALIELGLK